MILTFSTFEEFETSTNVTSRSLASRSPVYALATLRVRFVLSTGETVLGSIDAMEAGAIDKVKLRLLSL